MISYRIFPLNPEAHIFETVLSVPEPDPQGQRLFMPAWIPGSYMIRDFARHVVSCQAESEGRALQCKKLDKQTWQVEPAPGPLTITLHIYAWDLSVRGAHLDMTHAYFNGPCVFPEVVGQASSPCEAEILLPDRAACAGWKVATGLTRQTGHLYEPGVFSAANYDELIDHPVEMAAFEHAEFDACNVPHRMVFSGKHYVDLARLSRDLKKICEYQIQLFGEPAPMQQYLFMTMVTENGYGGLEHRNSTSLMCARNDLPKKTDPPGYLSEGYRTYLGLCSHEYFHSWNIKRIKPAAFTPFDLSKEVHTELLWAFEGITSYYDDLTLVRTGLIKPESYLELLGQTLTRVYRGEGRFKQTVTESSFDAWTRFYKQDENAPNAIVSYYTKGSLIALALDLTMRDMTAEQHSLDDLMRMLWERYGKSGQGVPEQGIQSLAEEITGQDMQAFFQKALYDTEDLPLGELLEKRGVILRWRPAASVLDNGGKAVASSNRVEPPVSLGVRVSDDALGARITVAYQQGSAMAAGLSAGDVIVAIDGLKASARNLDALLSVFSPGDKVPVHAFRGDVLMRFDVLMQVGEPSTAWLEIAEPGLSPAGRCWLQLD